MNSKNSTPIEWPTTLLLIFSAAIAVVGGLWYQLAVGFKAYHWLAFAVMAGLTGMSITAGYHRLWAHRAYKAHPALRFLLACFGAAAYQNSIKIWASQHRRHHRHVDDNDRDPYSANKGLWFSHVGWLLREYQLNKDDFTNIKDLERDKIVVWQHKYYYSIALVMNLLPSLLLGALTGEYLAFILSAGFIRMVYTHHTTFFINSLAHYWGTRPYTTQNTARDNGILALLTYGEGYHNFHHKFQADYRNGIRWYQFDPTKWLIKCCSFVGLTTELKTTPKFQIREALVLRQLERARDKLKSARLRELPLAQLARAQDSLSNTVILDRWHEYLEKEKTQFSALLNEWRSTRAEWFNIQRDKLIHAKEDLMVSMQKNALGTRLQELEFAIQMQYQRLCQFNAALA